MPEQEPSPIPRHWVEASQAPRREDVLEEQLRTELREGFGNHSSFDGLPFLDVSVEFPTVGPTTISGERSGQIDANYGDESA